MTDAVDALAAGVLARDRQALARAITLVESSRRDHRADANQLIEAVLPHTGKAARIGFSGAPGAGKSTLIEALGVRAIAAGHRVAVLAIDPSSARSGGSILGDKTRMSALSASDAAFVRPTPSRGVLGGVARHTREAVLLCEAAGFDVIAVETVGVGQSEVAVAELVDLFVLVASPTGGDELQGIKRGIMELADVIAVSKADGDLVRSAMQATADLRAAVQLLRPKRPGWPAEVLTCSAVTGDGIARLWTAIDTAHRRLRSDNLLGEVRASQAIGWMWREVSDALIERFRSDPVVIERLDELQRALAAGEITPSSAADLLLDLHARHGSAERHVPGGE